MVPEEDKSYNLANVVMSIGILLTIVPIGFFMITGYATPGLSAKELIGVGFWFLVMALLPIGLAFFIGGLGWIIVIKRNAKKADLAQDEAEAEGQTTEQPVGGDEGLSDNKSEQA
jgi:uncharacterized membrane protein